MFIIIALFVPRLVAVYLWLFTDWFSGVFDTHLWPVLGFVLMPYTMLWYSAVSNWYGGGWGTWQIVLLVIAILCDLSSGGKGASDSR